MEICVIATLQAKTECFDDVNAAVHQVIDASRRETGNLQYDLHCELDKPDTFVFFERWVSADALAQHSATEHFQRFIRQVDGKLDLLDIKKLKKIA